MNYNKEEKIKEEIKYILSKAAVDSLSKTEIYHLFNNMIENQKNLRKIDKLYLLGYFDSSVEHFKSIFVKENGFYKISNDKYKF